MLTGLTQRVKDSLGEKWIDNFDCPELWRVQLPMLVNMPWIK